MLWTIFVILLVLWLLGMVTSYTLGGFIHLLLVIAVIVIVIRLLQDRRPSPKRGRPLARDGETLHIPVPVILSVCSFSTRYPSDRLGSVWIEIGRPAANHFGAK